MVRRRRAGCGRVSERGGDGGSVAGLPGVSAASGAGDPPDDDQRGQAAEHGKDLVPPRPQRTRRPPVMSGGRERVLTIGLLRGTRAGVPAPFWAAAGFAGPIVRRPTSAGPAGRSGEDTISGPDTIREAALQRHCPYRLVTADSSRLPFPPRGCGAALSRSKDAAKAVAVHGRYEADISLLPGCVRLRVPVRRRARLPTDQHGDQFNLRAAPGSRRSGRAGLSPIRRTAMTQAAWRGPAWMAGSRTCTAPSADAARAAAIAITAASRLAVAGRTEPTHQDQGPTTGIPGPVAIGRPAEGLGITGGAGCWERAADRRWERPRRRLTYCSCGGSAGRPGEPGEPMIALMVDRCSGQSHQWSMGSPRCS
jgi:hypothetical protein